MPQQVNTKHILLFSDRYAYAFTVRYDRIFRYAEAVLACDHVCSFTGKQLEINIKKRNRNICFCNRKSEISLVSGFEPRFVGHIDRFFQEKNLLFDVTLKSRRIAEKMEIYSASGTLLIGEEEYLFAPAHSAAVIIRHDHVKPNTWLSASVIDRTPNILRIKDLTAQVADIVVPGSGTQEVLTRQITYNHNENPLIKNSMAKISGEIEMNDGRKMNLDDHWFVQC